MDAYMMLTFYRVCRIYIVGCQFPYFCMQCFNGLILTTSVRLRLPLSPLIAEQSNLNQVLLRDFTVQLVIAHLDQCYTGLIFQYIYHKHQKHSWVTKCSYSVIHNRSKIPKDLNYERSQKDLMKDPKGSDERSQRIWWKIPKDLMQQFLREFWWWKHEIRCRKYLRWVWAFFENPSPTVSPA